MRKNYKKIFMCLTMIAGFVPVKSYAQSVDYTGLKEVYGQSITTSANGSPLKENDAPLSMEIIDAEEISRMGARTIPEILRFIPGVSVNQHTLSQSEVSIRGYNQYTAERILVLLNGRHVYSDVFGQVVWENIPVEIAEIKQIEVIKGPNTALFGFNAVSGVINIITINPLHDTLNTIELRTGTQGLVEGTAVFSGKLTDTVGVKLSAGGFEASDPYDSVSSVIQKNPERGSISGDFWWQPTESIQANLEITNNRVKRNEFFQIGASQGHNETNVESVRGRIIADTKVGLIEADVYHNEFDGGINIYLGDATSTAPIPITFGGATTVAQLVNTFDVGKNHIFRVDGEYRSAHNIFETTDNNDLKTEIWSASVLWDWAITDKLRSSIGARYDNFELMPDGATNISKEIPSQFSPFSERDFYQKSEETSYNLGLVYKPTDDDTFRLSAAKGVDVSSFLEFGAQFFFPPSSSPVVAVGVFGSPTVDPSEVYNYELAYDRKIKEIDGQVKAAVFYQYNEEMQVYGENAFTIPNAFGPGLDYDLEQYGNIGDSEMYGVELAVDGVHKDKWHWGVNYAFININDDFRNQKNGNDVSPGVDYEDTNIEHVLNTKLDYVTNKWNAGVRAQYRASTKGLVRDSSFVNLSDFNLIDIEDEMILNANLSVNVTDEITWNVSGTSLLGDTKQGVLSEAETMVWTGVKIKF